MWQLYSFGAILFETLEETIDKATMVGHKSIDLLSATWIRNLIFLVITIIGAFVIDRGAPTILLSEPIIFLGILYAINAIFYSVLLKQIEITASSVLEKFIPLIFLPIDIFIIGNGFFSRQILGIFILVFGGFVFFSRRKNSTFRFSRNQIYLMICVFLFDAILFGFESYLFKDLFKRINLSETSFLVSVWGITLIFLTILLLIKSLIEKKSKLNSQILMRYSRGTMMSKLADFGNSFFLLKALSIASTSQVSAMESFYPIMLIVVVIIAQKKLNINVEEVLDRHSIKRKVVGIIIICAGVVLVR
jgi:uncharacterized membrane protein